MTRFWIGLLFVLVGLTLITVCWALRKRDSTLYVEPEVTDATHERAEPPSNVKPLRRAS